MNTPLSFIYGLFVMIWSTVYIQSWKRTENIIANEWLVRGYEDRTVKSNNFEAEMAIDPSTQHKEKIDRQSAFRG